MTQGQRRGNAPNRGLGVIKCGHCGVPTRDHSILELCPELVRTLKGTKLTVSSPRTIDQETRQANRES